MTQDITPPPRPAGAGQTLVEYILEKTGAAPKPAAAKSAPNGATKGQSLVDYILEKTTGAKAKTNGAASHKDMNGATPPGGTLKDWILSQTSDPS